MGGRELEERKRKETQVDQGLDPQHNRKRSIFCFDKNPVLQLGMLQFTQQSLYRGMHRSLCTGWDYACIGCYVHTCFIDIYTELHTTAYSKNQL